MKHWVRINRATVRQWLTAGVALAALRPSRPGGAATADAAPPPLTEPAGTGQGTPPTGAQRQNVAGRLRQFSRSFGERSAQTEQDFVQLGQALRGLYTTATELARLVSTRAEELGRALAESRMAGPDGLAARKLKELRGALEQTAKLLQALREVGGAVYRLQGQVKGLERVAVFLSASVFSFAVESSRTPACQEAFGTFIAELRDLAGRIARLEDRIGDQVQVTRARHAQGLDEMTAGLDRMHGLAQDLERSASATAAEAQVLLDQVLAVLEQAQARARHIAQQADEAVYYLQFGDIIRQKLEHICVALEEGAGLLESAAGPKADGGIAGVAGVIDIQIRQLELIQQELAAAQAKLEGCFASLGEESQGLAGALDGWQGRAGSAAPGSDPLAVLAQDAHRVEALHGQGLELQEHARAKARQAAEELTHLAAHLDEVTAINRDMHLQALNAIIKTAGLGRQGTTLEVLSMHVDSLFRDSNQQVTEIVATVQSIVRQAQATDAASDAAAALKQAGADLAGGLARVGQAYAQFGETSTSAVGLVERQRAALDGTRAGLRFLSEFSAALAEQVQGLRDLRQTLGVGPAASGVPAAETMAALGLQYTMQSERDVHQQALQPGAAPAAAAGDLELFDAPEPGPPAAPPEPVVSDPPPAGTEQKPEPASAPAPAASPGPSGEPAKSPEPGLGDNIEFF